MHQRPYEKMIVWQEAYKLCLGIYRVTTDFPTYERYGLTNQMRRASSSIAINLAEGNAKRTKADKIRYFDIAFGSLEELHCESRLSRDLEYLSKEKFERIDRGIHRVSYLLTRLRASFEA